MRQSRRIDMTRGSVVPLALRFALPLCIGNILQQMYLTADMMVVGNYCSAASLAALGTSGQPVEIMLMLFMGVGTGVSILVAQYTGSGEGEKLNATLATAICFLFLVSLPLSVAGVLIGPAILRGMQVPADTFSYALDYMCILFWGTLASMGYNMNAGILRGMGDSQSSLVFLAVSCVMNVVLDVVFIVCFHMDVSGAALATIISQYASWLLSIIYIRKKYPSLGFTFLPRRFDRKRFRDIIRVGVPLGVNNSFYSVGHLLMQSLINAQGSAFIAACAVGSKMTGYANIMITSLSMATSTYAGQNYGAGRFDRLRRGVYIPILSGAITLAAGLLVTVFARPLTSLFTDDPQVLELCVLYMWVVQPFCWCYAVFNGLINLANGIGEMRYPTIVNVLMLWVVRIPVGHLIARVFGGTYVMAAMSISFVFGMCCMIAFLLSARWKDVCRRARHMRETV